MENMNDPIKCESFSIGMTLLSIALLQNLFHLYDLRNNELNEELLAQYLATLDSVEYSADGKTERYSPTLKRVIREMVRIDPAQRLGSQQIYQLLKNHTESIVAMRPFELEPFQVEDQKPPLTQVPSSPLREVISLRSKRKPTPPCHSLPQ
jgi:hypothetical protein